MCSFCIFFVNVSLLSLYMRTGVFLVFYCLIMFLLCALYVFSGIVEYVFKFSLCFFFFGVRLLVFVPVSFLCVCVK